MTPALTYSILALIACIGLGMFCYRQHTRPHDKFEPRMVPWVIIAIGCLAVSFMIVVHIANVLGFETGNR